MQKHVILHAEGWHFIGLIIYILYFIFCNTYNLFLKNFLRNIMLYLLHLLCFENSIINDMFASEEKGEC